MFSRFQWRIFIGCFVAYTGAYISRLNLSAALPTILTQFDITEVQAGLLQTVFALTYAGGQLVNGAIVDHINPRRFILIGLLSSAFCNFLFGSATAYWQLIVLWCLNGVAQSMIWTPIVKIISLCYVGKERQQVSFGMSMTLVLGHVLAWGVAGYMASRFAWRMSFFVPSVITGMIGICTYLLLKQPTKVASDDNDLTDIKGEEPMPLGAMFLKTGLIGVLCFSLANGFVRDGIMTWAPTMLSAIEGIDLKSVFGITLIIPGINLLGILFGRYCYKVCRGSARVSIGFMMAMSSIATLLLVFFGTSNGILCALLLGICCAFMFGINPILTTLVPMEYDKFRRVGLIAGMVDCFIYLGSSLAGVMTGALKAVYGWNSVYLLWILVALLAAGSILASHRAAPKEDATVN